MPAETRDLTGTVVAITGASSGIGAATARLLVEEGAKVVLGARRLERLEEIVAEVGADNARAMQMDVRRPEDGRELVRTAVQAFGRIDSIVANAGVGLYGGILDWSDEELATMMDTNVAGTVWPVRAAIAAMLEADAGGDVIVLGSVAGLRGGANEAVYAATKFAQLGLAGSIDRELRTAGIRVSTIAPAATKTEFAIGAGRTAGDPSLDTFLQPEDVAAAIVTVLRQPRRMRTTLWTMWSMAEGG